MFVVERIDRRGVFSVIGVLRWNQPIFWDGDAWMLCIDRKRLQEKALALSFECELVGRNSNRVIFGNVLLCDWDVQREFWIRWWSSG